MSSKKLDNLRKKSEEILKKTSVSLPKELYSNTKELIHELQVHQIELEIQNENLSSTQNQLENSRNEYAELYHKAPTAYLALNENGIIEQVNETFLTMIGMTSEQCLHKPISMFLEAESRQLFLSRFNAIIRVPEKKFLDLNFVSRNNSFWGRLTARLANEDTLNLKTKLLVAISDITEQKKAEEELKSAMLKVEEASRAKSDFLARMSHELRTPLNSILGFSDLLQNSLHDPNSLKQIKQISGAAEMLLEMINTILDFSKIEAGKLKLKPSNTNIRELMEETYDMITVLAQEKKLSFTLSIPENLPATMIVDSLRLKQVLVNLLNNAVKFTSEGSIELKIFFKKIDNHQGYFKFQVKDTGIGINQAEQKNIFNPFSQNIEKNSPLGGTGLGLTISDWIIKKMGSSINVKSTLGKGSTFSFELLCDYSHTPIPEEIHISKLQDSEQDFITHKSISALIVDDVPTNRMITRSMIEKFFPNLNVYEAYNGKQALEMCHKIKPDLILLDLLMPDMSGEEFLHEYQTEALSNNTVLMIISGKKTIPDYDKLTTLGVKAYLYKPVRFFELKEELEYHFLKENENFNQLQHMDYKEMIHIVHGDIALLNKMYKVATQQFDKDINLLDGCIKDENFSNIKEYAHRLKGASASLCFKRLSTLSSLLHKSSVNQNILEAKELFQKIQNEWQLVKDLIKKILA